MSASTRSFDLFNRAVAHFEAGQSHAPRHLLALEQLVDSARSLKEALQLTSGAGDKPAGDALEQILALGENPRPITLADYRVMRARYLRTLHETRAHLAAHADGAANTSARTGSMMVVLVIALIVALAVGHRWAHPSRSVADTLQIYWLAEGSSWKEDHSSKLTIKTDNVFKRHVFILPTPVHITRIRLDPSMQMGSEIEVRNLELVLTDSKVINFNLAADHPKWQSRNISRPMSSKTDWRFTAESVDPYVTSPPFPAAQVKQVNVEMRSRLPVSLVRWLLGGY